MKPQLDRNAVFIHAHPIATAIEEFRITQTMNVPNVVDPGSDQNTETWFFGEYQMAYDPCACTRTDFWTFEIKIVSQADVQLVARGRIQQVIDTAENTVIAGKNPVMTSLNELKTKGQNAYEKWSDYKSDANKFVNEQNTEFTKQFRNDIKKWYEIAIEDLKARQGEYSTSDSAILMSKYALIQANPTAFNIAAVWDLPDGYGQPVNIFNFIKTDFKTFATVAKAIKPITNALPYVGTALAVVDFFTAGGNKETTNKNVAPMSFDIDMNIEGTITTTVANIPRTIAIPGTDRQATSPLYNNLLGTISLLKTPTMAYERHVPDNVNVSASNIPDRLVKNFMPDVLRYHLKDPLRYVLNPASNLEVEGIDAAYVFEFGDSNGNFFIDTTNNGVGWKTIPPYLRNPLFEQGPYDFSLTFEQRLKKLGYEVEHWDKYYPSDSTPTIRFRTEYLPLACFHERTIEFYSGTAKPKIYIKLLVKLRPKNTSTAEPVIVVLTYEPKIDVAPIRTFEYTPEIGDRTSQAYTTYILKVAEDMFLPEYFHFGLLGDWDGMYDAMSTNSAYLLSLYPYFASAGRSFYISNINHSYWPNIQDKIAGTYYADSVVFPTAFIVNSDTGAYRKVVFQPNTAGIWSSTGPIITAGEEIIVYPDNEFLPHMTLRLGNPAFECANTPVTAFHATNKEIDSICTDPLKYVDRRGYAKKEDEQAHPQEQNDNTLDNNGLYSYPNPFREQTTIRYEVETDGPLHIVISNTSGQVVADLLNTAYHPVGTYQLDFEAHDLPQGVYFCTMTTAQKSVTKRLVVLRR
ncbi:MAG: T9SS type A sorting domain-containing protein [Cytophagales bacterium]|nr:T9SS type A sorting domain-containing protein [Cytophagales bacterium]